MPRRTTIIAALEWAFSKIGRPSRRLAQNADHYDHYFKIEALIAEAKAQPDIEQLAADYLSAQLVLAAHPDNDSTKRFDRKLAVVEVTETALKDALVAQGYEIKETD